MRELSNNTSSTLDLLEDEGRPILITRRGRPVAVLSAIDKIALDDFMKATAPSFAVHRSES